MIVPTTSEQERDALKAVAKAACDAYKKEHDLRWDKAFDKPGDWDPLIRVASDEVDSAMMDLAKLCGAWPYQTP